MRKRVIVLAIVLCLVLVITGCQEGALKTRKVLPEWSRGLPVGVAAVSQPVAIQAEGGYVHMVWVAAGGTSLHYSRLNHRGSIEVETDLEMEGAHPGYPRLALDRDGGIRVLWMDNPGIPRALFFARLSPDGRLLSDPRRLSAEGVRVSDYDLARDADDGLLASRAA